MWIILRARIDYIVRSDHQHHVGVGEIVVQLVHFKNDVIGHLGFRQQHVHVARQATRDRMNAEAHFYALVAQKLGDFADRILCLRYRHTVSWHDDDLVGIRQHGTDLVDRRRHYFTLFFARSRHAAGGTEPAKDDADKVPVHGAAHDVAEDSAGRADQRANNDQQVIGQHEARRRCGPAGIAVQHGHHHRHICTANRHHQMNADEESNGRHYKQRRQTGIVIPRVQEFPAEPQRSDDPDQVQPVTRRQQ